MTCGESRVTWEIDPRDGGLTYLTSPTTSSRARRCGVSGEGWTHVLSGLKTLLETGEPLYG